MFRKNKTAFVALLIGTLGISLGATSTVCPLIPRNPTPTPVPTASAIPTATKTATPTGTATATATPTPSTLFSSTIVGNAAVTGMGVYPTSFFTAGATGDISNNAAGTGSITPTSSTKTVNVTVTGGVGLVGYLGRPQIQFKNASVTITAPQNTTSATLTFSFVPNTTSALPFSIIDTAANAAGISYAITITQ